MPPTPSDVGIQSTPAFIHKIDTATCWDGAGDIEQQITIALARIFKRSDSIYSFWRVESEFDLHRIAASLNAGRGSNVEPIPFLWTTDLELKELQLEPKQVDDEGKCLYARKLHYDVTIEPVQAEKLCRSLMTAGRKAHKITKGQMKQLVPSLMTDGCRVYETELNTCKCQSSADPEA